MSKYKCKLCGHIYDEMVEKVKFDDLPDDWKCPLCGAPKFLFEKMADEEKAAVKKEIVKLADNKIENYLKEYERENEAAEVYMNDIHEMAKTGKPLMSAMSTNLPMASFNDVLILGAQLNPMPLKSTKEVSLQTVIGKKAKKPLIIESPIIISHMSFGALSKEAKIALAKGSAEAKTATSSGEGGILPEEIEAAYGYIFEYVPNKYSVNDDNLKRVSAIEIKIGQGTKPGMGGHLPGSKVTEEIAKIRGKEIGEDIVSPSRFEEIKTKEDLKVLVSDLRVKSEGRPIGIKLAAGHIEEDLEWVTYADPDFITIDGRGGATGSSPKMIRDATSVPTIYALHRTLKYLKKHNLDIDVIITGGLRTSADFAKALAMGATAIAIASAAMMALACQQYRICNSGKCPVGIATQDDILRSRLDVKMSAKRLENYLLAVNEELRMFGQITGHENIHELGLQDIVTTSREISKYTDIKHV